MSHFKTVKLALDTRLAALSGGTPVAWENIAYKPTLQTMYIRPTLLPIISNTMTMQGIQTNPGIYQIDVFAPLGNGVRSVLDKMDEVYDHFKEDITLNLDSIDVHIRAVSQLGPLSTEGGWLVGSVQINYDCYAN